MPNNGYPTCAGSLVLAAPAAPRQAMVGATRALRTLRTARRTGITETESRLQWIWLAPFWRTATRAGARLASRTALSTLSSWTTLPLRATLALRTITRVALIAIDFALRPALPLQTACSAALTTLALTLALALALALTLALSVKRSGWTATRHAAKPGANLLATCLRTRAAWATHTGTSAWRPVRIGIAVGVDPVDPVAVIAHVFVQARIVWRGTTLRTTRLGCRALVAFFLDAERGQQRAHIVFFHLFPAAAL